MVTKIDKSGFLRGKIESREDILIEGKFEGEIKTEGKIIISRGAYVKGPISCDSIEVGGIVEGEVNSKGSTKIFAFGKIQGDLTTGHLFVEDGGILGGKVTTRERTKFIHSDEMKK